MLKTRGRPSPLVARSVWAIVAQGASSASNVVLSLLVLTTATRAQFGTFSVCLVSYLLAAQLLRSFLSTPILILYSSDMNDETRASTRTVVGLVVVTSAMVSVILAGGALAWSAGRGLLLVLAVLLPLLLYQDAVRHVAFARGAPRMAAATDLLWLMLQVTTSAAVLASGHGSPTLLLAVWALSGAASGCVFGVVLGVTPQLRGRDLTRWLRRHRALCMGLLSEFAIISGSSYVVYYGLSIVAGIDQLGRIRAAQTFMGPVMVALLGGAALGVAESARLRGDPNRLRRFAVLLAIGLAIVALITGALAYWLLPEMGPRFFPHTWSGARPVLPALTVLSVAVAASIGAVSPLRAHQQVSRIVRLRLLTGCLAIAIGLPSAALFGASGAVGALGVTEALFAMLAWVEACRFLACRPIEVDEGQPTAEVESEVAAWDLRPGLPMQTPS